MRPKLLPTRVLAALFLVGCADAAAPNLFGPFEPEFAIVPSVQPNGQFTTSGTAILKGFNPTNPHHGDAIVATFFFPTTQGNIITSVSDHLANGTPVGNTYQLVDFVTAGGIGMATYVAVNVQNFPDPNVDASGNPDPNTVLAIQADLSTSITRGGMTITAYSGVQPTFAQALGAASHGSGSSDAQTMADAGTVSVAANALVYAVTLANQLVGLDPPPGFVNISTTSDGMGLKADAERMIQGSAGTAHPTWVWGFNSSAAGTHPATWLASVFSLNEAPTGSNQPPTAAFTSSCTNLTCTFTNSSSDPDGSIASSSWDFGDGTTSTVASPSHSYAAAGTYNVTLTVTDNQSATNSVVHSVTVSQANQSPTAAFTSSCSNLTCTFTNSSSDPDGSIASNSWDFGDGTTSTVASPSHSYAAGGTYNITLTVTDNQQATNSVVHSVTVSQANQSPTAAFTSSCTNLTCTFTNGSSDPDGSIASNSWNFGDGTTSTVASPSHSYTAAGSYNVTLTVTDNQGATNSVVHSVTVSQANQSPTAAFTSSCTNLSCSFTNTSSDPDGSIASNSWNFGDGTTSTVASPSHSYAAGGTYTVTLTVTDNQNATGSVSHSVTVTAPNQAPTANFTFSCNALSCNFTSTSSDPDGSIASYSWTFGDGGTSTAQNPSHSYAAGGNYTVTLRVTDNQGAQSALTSKTVTVTAPNQAPTANFTFSCNALSCSFTSTSSDPDGSIASYSWTFGDGGTSTAQNPSHSYATGGNYTVTLRVTDNQGAQSAPTSKTVTVTAPNQPPVAAFSSSCSGDACNFTNTSSDPDGSIASNSWNFGDGQTSITASPSHTYTASGTYTVQLTVTDNQGATNSVSHTVTVNRPPVAAFSSSCSGLTCSFTSTSSDPDGSISSYSWNFGDGQTSTAQNPSHPYGAGGTYTVTLTVTDNRGATNSVQHSVTVTPPNTAPVVNAGPDETVILGLLYTLNASFSDPDNGPWTYTINWGDGSSSSGSRSTTGSFSAGHTYTGILTTRTITVTVTDSRGASGSDTKVITLIL